MKTLALAFTALTVFAIAGVSAEAQEINLEPGSPSATMTIDGKQLPAPPLEFGGAPAGTEKVSPDALKNLDEIPPAVSVKGQ